ncbi:hypothetical protein [Hydrogenobacter thermophilus]|uniref:hypothetical protein n=1 Tax=Hydrogenobacter thermophilus TaxID=940 RepID=UPI0030F93B7F
MELIKLTEDLLTGVPEMDEDHQMLVDMLNETYSLIAEGKREEAKNILKMNLCIMLSII